MRHLTEKCIPLTSQSRGAIKKHPCQQAVWIVFLTDSDLDRVIPHVETERSVTKLKIDFVLPRYPGIPETLSEAAGASKTGAVHSKDLNLEYFSFLFLQEFVDFFNIGIRHLLDFL